MIQLSTPALPNVPRLPKTIISLYYLKYYQMSQDELMAECERVFQLKLAVTREEAKYLPQSAILQSQSLLWFEHRKGQITASYFGSVFHTCLDSPSQSLISSILQQKPTPDVAAQYTTSFKFFTFQYIISQFYGQFSQNVKFWLAIYITKRLFPNIQARRFGLQFKYRDFFAGKISERSKVNAQKLAWSMVKLPKRPGQSFDPRSQL